MELCSPDFRTTCERNVFHRITCNKKGPECLARARVLRKRAHLKGFLEFLLMKSAREVPAFHFFPGEGLGRCFQCFHLQC
ncbi:hypothetical protein TNCV_722651 [Trichonephila clavipes]|nr:hypothetical protein TNCV_722651 [Trichonephila clavipes]